MILKEIIIDNIRIHKHIDIVPSLNGVTSISGTNGAGKSTIVDAFAWSIFGTRLHNLRNRHYIRRGVSTKDSPVQVTSIIEVDGQEYKILRKLTSDDGVCSCWVSLKDKNGEFHCVAGPSVTHSEAFLRKLLKTNEKGFLTSTYIQQKKVDFIIDASPSERANTIEQLLGITTLSDMIKIAKEQARDLTASASVLENIEVDKERAQLETLKAEAIEISNNISQKTEQLSKLVDDNFESNKLYKKANEERESYYTLRERLSLLENTNKIHTTEITKITEGIKALDKKEVGNTDFSINEINAKLTEINNDLSSYKKDEIRLQIEIENINKLLVNYDGSISDKDIEAKEINKKQTLEELSNSKGRAAICKSEIKRTKRQIEALKSNNDNKCPTCGEPLTQEQTEELISNSENNLSNYTNELSELSNKIETLDREIKKIDIDLDVSKKKYETSKELKVKKEILDEKLTPELYEVQSNIRRLSTKLDIWEQENKKAKEFIQKSEQIEMLKNKITTNENEIKTNNIEIKKLTKEIEKYIPPKDFEELRKKYDLYQLNYNELNTELVKSRAILTSKTEQGKALLKLYNEHSEANKKYKKIQARLEIVNMAINILTQFKKFKTQSSLRELQILSSDILENITDGALSNIVFNNKYEVSAKRNGYQLSVEELSGGEKSQVAIAIRIAIAQLSSSSHSLLILDEILVSMSEEVATRILEFLSTMTNRQILLIAHNSNIDSVADKIISI